MSTAYRTPGERSDQEPQIIVRERALSGWSIALLAVLFLLMGVGNYYRGQYDEKHKRCRDVVLTIGAWNEACPYAGQTLEDAKNHPICRCPK